jgi:hypothetical protein
VDPANGPPRVQSSRQVSQVSLIRMRMQTPAYSDEQSERAGPAAYHPSRDRAEQHTSDENWRIRLRHDRVRNARENADEDPGCDG